MRVAAWDTREGFAYAALFTLLLAAFVAFGVYFSGLIRDSHMVSLRHELAALQRQLDGFSSSLSQGLMMGFQSLTPGEGGGAKPGARDIRPSPYRGLARAFYFFPLPVDPQSPQGLGTLGQNLGSASPGPELSRALDAIDSQLPFWVVTQGERTFCGYLSQAAWGPEPGPGLREGLYVMEVNEDSLTGSMIPSLAPRYLDGEKAFSAYLIRARRGPNGPIFSVQGAMAQLRKEGVDWAINRPLFTREMWLERPDPARIQPMGRKPPLSPHMPRPSEWMPTNDWLAGEREPMPRVSPNDWVLQARHRSGSLERVAQLRSGLSLGLTYGFLVLVYGLTLLLAHTIRRLRALSRREQDFTASVTHELKTPIAVILAAADNIGKGIIPSERLSLYAETLRREGFRLRNSVDTMLLVSGLKAGYSPQMAEEPISLNALVGELLESHRILGLTRGIELRLTEDAQLTVKASKALLAPCIEALIGNAVKYGPQSSVVDIWLGQSPLPRAFSRKSAMALITVSDLGPGLELGERTRLFTPYFRGKAAMRSGKGGTGLGLYLARRIARLYRGDIRYRQGKSGIGSIFILSLPKEAT